MEEFPVKIDGTVYDGGDTNGESSIRRSGYLVEKWHWSTAALLITMTLRAFVYVPPLESSAAQDDDCEGETGRTASKLCKSSFDREVCNVGKVFTSLDASPEYRSYDDRQYLHILITRRLALHGFCCLEISSFQMFNVEGSFCQNRNNLPPGVMEQTYLMEWMRGTSTLQQHEARTSNTNPTIVGQ